MKKLFLLTLTIAALSYSCDKLLDFSISNTFNDSFQVDLPADGDTTYAETFSFDATDNQDVADNIDNISGYTLSSLKLSISDYEGADTVGGSFTVSFKNSSGNPIGDIVTLTVDNLGSLSASGDKVDIPLSQATIDAVQSELTSNNTITVVLEGTVSEVPVKFLTNIFLAVEINVSP